MINVTIFNEFIHEREDETTKAVYPDGMHITLKNALESDDIKVTTITLDDIKDGIDSQLLKNTDVMLWWGHVGHDFVPDEVAKAVGQEVLKGMGMVFLHSAHHSKPFKLLMGTPCNLTWREDGDSELVWVCNPSHPIAQGIGRFIKLEHEETYGEPFSIPEPDELVFIGSFEGGEVFRAGCCYKRFNGKIFYFQPGHETFPTYKNSDVITVIKNAIYWANPIYRVAELECPHVKKPLED